MSAEKLAREIKEELENIKSIQRDLRKVMELKSEGWKLQYVAGRRALSDSFAHMYNITSDVSTIVLNEEIISHFRSAFSTMRRMTAVHQSSWPVVTIESVDEDYRQSLQMLERANANFYAAADRFLKWIDEQSHNH